MPLSPFYLPFDDLLTAHLAIPSSSTYLWTTLDIHLPDTTAYHLA